MNEIAQSRLTPIVLLTVSNVFMTFAWYGHLKFKSAPLWLVNPPTSLRCAAVSPPPPVA